MCASLPFGCAGDGALGWLQSQSNGVCATHRRLCRLQTLWNRVPNGFPERARLSRRGKHSQYGSSLLMCQMGLLLKSMETNRSHNLWFELKIVASVCFHVLCTTFEVVAALSTRKRAQGARSNLSFYTMLTITSYILLLVSVLVMTLGLYVGLSKVVKLISSWSWCFQRSRSGVDRFRALQKKQKEVIMRGRT